MVINKAILLVTLFLLGAEGYNTALRTKCKEQCHTYLNCKNAWYNYHNLPYSAANICPNDKPTEPGCTCDCISGNNNNSTSTITEPAVQGNDCGWKCHGYLSCKISYTVWHSLGPADVAERCDPKQAPECNCGTLCGDDLPKPPTTTTTTARTTTTTPAPTTTTPAPSTTSTIAPKACGSLVFRSFASLSATEQLDMVPNVRNTGYNQRWVCRFTNRFTEDTLPGEFNKEAPFCAGTSKGPGGKGYQDTNSTAEVLTNPGGNGLVWSKGTGNGIPTGAILGGATKSGDKLYVARETIPGLQLMAGGKVFESMAGLAFVPYRGSEYNSTDFEFLVCGGATATGTV